MEATRRHLSKIPVIFGPTASGKTALSERIASIDPRVEIISADSSQVYRGLDIGTAKVDPDVRARTSHHLIDIIEPTERYTAGMFARDATKAIEEIKSRGNQPLIVGGTGFYLRALFHGLSAPPASASILDELSERLDSEGIDALRKELLTVDPVIGSSLDLSNREKIVRALATSLEHGVPYSQFLNSDRSEGGEGDRYAPTVLLINPEREVLNIRINDRVERMIADGLIEEVIGIIESGVSPSSRGLRSVGYPEVVSYLHGEIDQGEMLELIKRNTRRYAKRQRTWMRTQIIPNDPTTIIENESDGLEWYRRVREAPMT